MFTSFRELTGGIFFLLLSNLCFAQFQLEVSTYTVSGAVPNAMISGNDLHDVTIAPNGDLWVTGRGLGNISGTGSPYISDPNNKGMYIARIESNGGSVLYDSYLGGNGDPLVIETDLSGNVYVAGYAFSGLDSSSVAYGGGIADAFIMKFSNNNQLVYCKYIGGSGIERIEDLVVDDFGNAYICGGTSSANFPQVGNGSILQNSFNGGVDAFVSILDPAGGLAYSALLGGAGVDYATGIEIGNNSEIYITGLGNLGYPTTLTSYQPISGGGEDIFISKISSDGTNLLFSTFVGGAGNEHGRDLALDGNGDVIITGQTTGSLPVTLNAYQTIPQGQLDGFVMRLSSDGSNLLHSSYLGGGSNDIGDEIIVTDQNGVYVYGNTNSLNFPVQNAIQSIIGGGVDLFLTHLDSSFSNIGISGSTYFGGSSDENESWGIAVNCILHFGKVFFCGRTRSTDILIRDELGGLGNGASVLTPTFPINNSDSGILVRIGSADPVDCPLLPLNSESVELHLNIESDQVLIEWQAVLNEEVGYYQLERASDSGNFSFLAMVQQGSNHQGSRIFHYDKNPLHGLSYYRLIAYSNEGEELTQIIEKIWCEKGLRLFPNPTTGVIVIEGDDFEELSLISITGELIRLLDIKSDFLDVSFLPGGVYFLRVSNKGITKMIRFIKV